MPDRRSPLLGALLTAFLASPAAAETVWPESYYNPQPLSDDVVLPMPCGGAMAFRRVATSSADGAIGDVVRTLGAEGSAQPYLDGLRRSFVAGGFASAAAGGNAHFYMAKYEIAEAQYAAVMESACPEPPRRRGFLPATDRSRLEFQAFAERYTLWLMREAPDALPAVGEFRGFIRLPTEDEWEYAARGGEAVDQVAFRAALPPLEHGEDPSEYIAHGGAGSAAGTVQVIGTLKPNPLGLHDMIGNVAEIVETPFAVVRHGRLHGRMGGFVKRGGDARTPLSSLSSATRFEMPPVDAIAGVPTRDRYTGARVVVAALAISSTEQAEALVAGLDQLARVDASLPSAASEEEVLALIDTLEAEASEPRSRARFALIRETLARARADRNAQRDKSIALLLGTGALVCDQALVRLGNVVAIESLLPSYGALREEAVQDGNFELVAEIEAAEAEGRGQLAEAHQIAVDFTREYANLVEGLSEDYPADALERQHAFLHGTPAMARARRAGCLDLFAHHIAERRDAGFVDVALIERDLRELADASP